MDIKDTANVYIQGHFNPIAKWITGIINSGGTVFCHCYNGVSRSATIVIAYLMSDHAMPLDAAILLTRKARNSIYPNPGFKT